MEAAGYVQLVSTEMRPEQFKHWILISINLNLNRGFHVE
jgi:hypothetical protein